METWVFIAPFIAPFGPFKLQLVVLLIFHKALFSTTHCLEHSMFLFNVPKKILG